MIPELLSDTNILPKPIKMSLIHISQRLTKASMPKLTTQQSSSTKTQQPIEKMKLRKIVHQKNKSFSIGISNTPVIKRQSSTKKQILELPSNIRSDSCSVDKVYVGSLLLKQRNSTRFYSKLPRVSVIEQVITESKIEMSRQKQRTGNNLLNDNDFHVQSRAIEIKSSNLLPNVIVSPRGNQREKITIKPPLPDMTPSGLNKLMMFREKERQRQESKKELIDILATRDSLNPRNFQQKSVERSVQRPLVMPQKQPTLKYKKGYLIYDNNCYNCIKDIKQQNSKQQLPATLHSFSSISSKLYCILDSSTFKIIHLNKTKEFVEIASLTKIVTCLLTILCCAKYQIDIKSYKCRVSEQSASMVGTSAELQTGDILTVQQLLYGLMLPSGNDAAVALAQCIGRIIQRKKKMMNTPNPATTFIKQMNVIYKQIIADEEKTQHHFKNPSGLPFNPNITTVEQITLFAAVAVKNSLFSKIVNTKSYQMSIFNQRYGITRKVVWKSTNKLLEKGWEGVKTGTTYNAGHCFIGIYGNNIYSLLDCQSLQKRFSEAEILKEMFADVDNFQKD